MQSWPSFLVALLLATAAHAAPAPARVPAALAVRGVLGAPPAGVSDVKFADMYHLPVGPAGLESSERLRALDGKRVRVVGYMVCQASPAAGSFILAPLPVDIGDDDEGLADDVPPTAIAVRLPSSLVVPHMSGLLRLTGRLELGLHEDSGSGRVLGVHLIPDTATTNALREIARTVATRNTPRP
jgi:hypothetical protein